MDFNYAKYSDSPLHKINDSSEAWVQEILVQSLLDTRVFAQSFLSESFEMQMTYQHEKVWQLLDDDEIARVAACIWRGFGKSTMVWAKAIKMAAFRQSPFNLFVGSEEGLATQQTEDIKTAFLTNEKLRDVFRLGKPQKVEGASVSFSKSSWFLADPKTDIPFCYFVPKGANQKMRGMNALIHGKKQRPTFISIDDVEDDRDIDNEMLRKKLKYWYDNSLLPCVAYGNPKKNRWKRKGKDMSWSPPWRIFHIDTLKHEDALMADLLERGDWESIRFPMGELKDGEWISLVPERISHAEFRAKVHDEKEKANFQGFCQEYLCTSVPPEGNAWRQEDFKYYYEAEAKLNAAPEADRFIIVDPARSTNTKSAFTAMLGVARDSEGLIYIRELVNERMEPDVVVEKTFEMAERLNAHTIAVEVTGLSEWLKYPYENERARRGGGYELLWVNAQRPSSSDDYGVGNEGAKRGRAAQMIQYYRRKEVLHSHESIKHSALEKQMLSYPKPRRWDALDCLAYIPRILQEAGRYSPLRIVEGPQMDGHSDYNHEAFGKAIAAGNWRSN